MSKGFARAVVRAGLDPKVVTPHVMRHTAITKLVQAGVDLPDYPAHQRAQDFGHGAALHACTWPAYRQGDRRAGRPLPELLALQQAARNYTSVLHSTVPRPPSSMQPLRDRISERAFNYLIGSGGRI